MHFKSVFVAVFIGTSLMIAALLFNAGRPARDTDQPTAAQVKATGKCAECHRRETGAIVHQFEASRHAATGVSCLDCHRPSPGQEAIEHHGFSLSSMLTSQNCKVCHPSEYEQFVRSRHALPAYAAVNGAQGASPEQIAQGEKYHPGTCTRPANALAQLEGEGAGAAGCLVCHNIGRPNADGSIGTCTHCHSRHNASVELARMPQTCGQCHMGPDHSQLEIYDESKHGILFAAQRSDLNLSAPAKSLTTRDMPVPTCATCHLSGLDGLKVTHDTTERLSWWLFAPVSKQRPGYQRGQDAMQEVCQRCHGSVGVEAFYRDAEQVVTATNKKVEQMKLLMTELREAGLLTPAPFDEPIEFLYFDYWHYFGRTAKHGAFMGGADFVQWHGNYELLKLQRELEQMAEELKRRGAK